MVPLYPDWCTRKKSGCANYLATLWGEGWLHCALSLPHGKSFGASRRGHVRWERAGWPATGDGLQGTLGTRVGRAGGTASGHSCPGVHISRTWTQCAVSCGSLRAAVMSHGTEPRVSSEPQHSTPWPLSSLVPVSLKSQDLWALTQVLASTHLVFLNPWWIKNSLSAPKDMS